MPVGFTCTGPRRAHRCTWRTLLCRSCCSACCAMSVAASCSTGRSSTRAQSSATLPMPHTATDSTQDRSTGSCCWSGCPLYHHTNSRAANTPVLSCARKGGHATEAREQWPAVCRSGMPQPRASASATACTHLSWDAQLTVALSSVRQHHLAAERMQGQHSTCTCAKPGSRGHPCVQAVRRHTRTRAQCNTAPALLPTHHVVQLLQLMGGHVTADAHVAKEADAPVLCDARELVDDVLRCTRSRRARLRQRRAVCLNNCCRQQGPPPRRQL